MANINDVYFDGHYKELWRAVIPEELTTKEVDFIRDYFKLVAGNRVLDLMCGYGRHSIALAKKGVEVTAVDNLQSYTNEIAKIAAAEDLPLTVVCTDVATFKSSRKFDLAICMGNSLNFFNEQQLGVLLENTASSLVEGGRLLINTWTIAEIAMRNFKDRAWSYVGEIKFLTDAKFLFSPTRIETESTMLLADGSTETKMAIDYIYSIAELTRLLNVAGLRLDKVYSIPGKKLFCLGEARAYITATRI